MSRYGTHVEGAEIRRVRQALGEDQTEFGVRFGKTRRTVIRWEQVGTTFSNWDGSYDFSTGKRGNSSANRWLALAAQSEQAAAKKKSDIPGSRDVTPRKKRKGKK